MDIEQLAGTRLGNYEIESFLGRGGMGVVYKALQLSLDRPVALKILPPALSSDLSFVRRFQREARAVAKLNHPNIVQIFDISIHDDLHFFSMEYVEGKTLDDVLKEKGKLSVDEAVRIIIQATQGIENAHENKILHRDIKPSNIILDKRGNVKVMDFGLARISGEGSKLTQSGTLMGTLDYMSPEQCRGEELDEQTDVYSLGVVLYEILTGRVPFDAPNEAALINKIINEEPPEARNVNRNVIPDLSSIVCRAMAKARGDRYASISELMSDLQNIEAIPSAGASGGRKSKPSIAVLPFVDMSPGKDQEYFCDGLAEELINALTQLKDLHVVARTSAFSFKDQNLDVREIGRKLNVETVLEGSVRKAGNRLRITGQLVNVGDGYHLWSERFDRNMEDVFAIQDEISEAIVDRLKPRLMLKEKKRLVRHQTVDFEVYSLYLKGRWFLNKLSGEGVQTAIECFTQAIEKAPDYAPAHAGLAEAYIVLPFYASFAPRQVFPLAQEAAVKALAIDEELTESHAALAHIKTFYEWDWDGAEREFRRAITLNPGHVHAHQMFAATLGVQTRLEEALQEIHIALELDPLSLFSNFILAEILLYAGQCDESIKISEKVIEMDSNYPLIHLYLGLAYFMKTMYDEAMAEFEKEKDVLGDSHPIVETFTATAYAFMGRQIEARQALSHLIERSQQGYIPPCFPAQIYFALGEKDKTFEWLDKAYEERDPFLCYLKVNPFLETLNFRSDPRYQELLQKINLAD